MKLAADEVRMRREFDHLHQRVVGREPAEAHPVLDQRIAVPIRHLIAMTVPFADFRLTVHFGGLRSALQAARIRAEAHRASHVGHVTLRIHQRNHRIAALWRELARMTVVEAQHVARELDDRNLHAEADSEERNRQLTRRTNRLDHPFHAAHAEAARDEQSVIGRENLARLLG